MKEKIIWSEHLYYDATSPSGLRWKHDAMRGRNYVTYARRKDDVAGSINGSGRWSILFRKTNRLAHRIVFEIVHGSIENHLFIDHIDGDALNNKIENLRLVERKINARNTKKRKDSNTIVTGVHLKTNYNQRTGEPYYYYTATWKDLQYKTTNKHFPISKYGAEEAFRLACEYRQKMIEELNEQGAGYSDRHGT